MSYKLHNNYVAAKLFTTQAQHLMMSFCSNSNFFKSKFLLLFQHPFWCTVEVVNVDEVCFCVQGEENTHVFWGSSLWPFEFWIMANLKMADKYVNKQNRAHNEKYFWVRETSQQKNYEKNHRLY